MGEEVDSRKGGGRREEGGREEGRREGEGERREGEGRKVEGREGGGEEGGGREGEKEPRRERPQRELVHWIPATIHVPHPPSWVLQHVPLNDSGCDAVVVALPYVGAMQLVPLSQFLHSGHQLQLS